jgi:uncharacterized protein DUF5670
LARARGVPKLPRSESLYWEDIVFALVAVVLLLAWLLGFFVVPVGGGLIHLLLIVALIAFIWHVVAGRGRSSV